jgi:predicted O-methyltransferase YrrM
MSGATGSTLLLLLCLVLACGSADESPASDAGAAVRSQPGAKVGQAKPHAYQKAYRFTADWFSPAIPVWEEALAPYVGKPDLRYLEVGVFQGRSLLWLLENVATDPSSRLTGVDLSASYSAENVALSGAADRIEMLEGRSQSVLRTLPEDSYDIIYIDGSHRGDDVLADAVLAWPLLRQGGTLIFDDYRWHTGENERDGLVLPAELRPKEAIDTFVTLFRDQLAIVDRSHQLILRREPPRCAGPDRRFCSRIGGYVYDWEKREVRDPATGAALELTPEELEVLEALLHSMAPGEVQAHAARELAREAAYPSLRDKLGLVAAP